MMIIILYIFIIFSPIFGYEYYIYIFFTLVDLISFFLMILVPNALNIVYFFFKIILYLIKESYLFFSNTCLYAYLISLLKYEIVHSAVYCINIIYLKCWYIWYYYYIVYYIPMKYYFLLNLKMYYDITSASIILRVIDRIYAYIKKKYL